MTEPVCHLDNFHFTRVNIAWHEPQEDCKVDVAYVFDYDVIRHVVEKNCYRLAFRVSALPQTPKPLGYAIDCEIAGFFHFPPDTPQETMDALIRFNGCTILYGIIRGQLAMITGSFPNRKFVLPTVMMEEVVNGIEKQKAAMTQTLMPPYEQTESKKK